MLKKVMSIINLLLSAILLVSFSCVKVTANECKTYEEDKKTSESFKLPEKEIIFDSRCSAYLFTKETFDKISTKSAIEYLKNKGIIIINDDRITNKELEEKLEIKEYAINRTITMPKYGIYIYNDSKENIVKEVTIDFLVSIMDKVLVPKNS